MTWTYSRHIWSQIPLYANPILPWSFSVKFMNLWSCRVQPALRNCFVTITIKIVSSANNSLSLKEVGDRFNWVRREDFPFSTMCILTIFANYYQLAIDFCFFGWTYSHQLVCIISWSRHLNVIFKILTACPLAVLVREEILSDIDWV